jgi:hypothetical protein
VSRRSGRALGHLLDVFVYAPIGFVLEAPHVVPELAEVGRQRLAAFTDLGRLVAGRAPRVAPVPAAEHTRAVTAVSVDEEITIEVVNEDRIAPSGPPEPLPIRGYDQLAASQVVARLDGLSRSDLDTVEAYELAHRARRTVLAKIAQLRRS